MTYADRQTILNYLIMSIKISIFILEIYSHGISFEKNPWQHGDSNLRDVADNQSTALLSTRPSCFPKKSRDKQLPSLTFIHVFPRIMSDANFMIFYGEA